MKRTDASRRVGLARALSKLGYCSRSEAFKLIRSGRVRLNERLRLDPETPVRLEKDHIQVDGRTLRENQKIYLILNKPRGIITSATDEKGRETVYELLDNDWPWVAPVGRLDKASEGLLLLTNDSEWSARVLAPETHLEKTYHVQIAAIVNTALLEKMRKGVLCAPDILRAKSALILRGGERNTWLEVILDEGKNRHIRRMLAQLGIEVIRLVRVAIGPLALGELPKRSVRQLMAEEKQAVDRAMERSRAAAANPGDRA
ncbi:MAG TPA: pseudouridine synthase [Terriglobales bacterium]|nr:pseudouridine synthase [Terriglobales bacterium]